MGMRIKNTYNPFFLKKKKAEHIAPIVNRPDDTDKKARLCEELASQDLEYQQEGHFESEISLM